MRLQSEESALKMQYRKLMAKDSRDEKALYQVFRKLIEIRCDLADSLGYISYINLGYHIQGRQDYKIKEITDFRYNIQKYITPVVTDMKAKGIALNSFPTSVANSKELISAIVTMYKDLSVV